MTDHAAAPAAERDRPAEHGTPVAGGPAPRLLMFGAADAPNCDGDGCAVPFAAGLPTRVDTGTNANADTEGTPE